MKCKSAVYVEKNDQWVRCGRCLGCRLKFRAEWAARIYFEYLWHWNKHGQVAQFLTLTYRDNKLPRTPEGDATLTKKKFQQWLKDTQKAIGVFRYYACGEYGKKATKRAHYHMVLFPANVKQTNKLVARWEKHFGFVQAYPLRDTGCGYVTKYATKYMEFNDRLTSLQEPEFRVSSRNPPLGQDFCLNLLEAMGEIAADHQLNVIGDVPSCIRSGGRIWPISTFLRNKMREKYGIPTNEMERIERCPSHAKYVNYEEPVNCPKEAQEQHERLIAVANQLAHRSRANHL